MPNPIRVCIVGAGRFAQCFIPLFKCHPRVDGVSLCDVDPDRLSSEAARFGIRRTFLSYGEALAARDVDAVAIFTERWTHAPMTLEALEAGKHVFSSVPAATTLDELDALVDAVRRTGLVYMMGETSQYYGARLFMKEKWDAGAFGEFVYAEGDYYHDITYQFDEARRRFSGDAWKPSASFPPMLYPTHSAAMILSVTGARVTKVSCLGRVDSHGDGVFDPEVSLWKNAFSNESALMRTDDGGMLRINEFRRIGHHGGRSVRGRLYGTEGSFEEQANGAVWTTRMAQEAEDVEQQIQTRGVYTHDQWERVRLDPVLAADFRSGLAPIHEKYRCRLPESYSSAPNGHEGSHQFLTDDFVTGVQKGTLPSVTVWDAARYNAPGIVAHASASRDGEWLTVPDFGRRPEAGC